MIPLFIHHHDDDDPTPMGHVDPAAMGDIKRSIDQRGINGEPCNIEIRWIHYRMADPPVAGLAIVYTEETE